MCARVGDGLLDDSRLDIHQAGLDERAADQRELLAANQQNLKRRSSSLPSNDSLEIPFAHFVQSDCVARRGRPVSLHDEYVARSHFELPAAQVHDSKQAALSLILNLFVDLVEHALAGLLIDNGLFQELQFRLIRQGDAAAELKWSCFWKGVEVNFATDSSVDVANRFFTLRKDRVEQLPA